MTLIKNQLRGAAGAMNDSKERTGEPSAELRAKQEAMREELEQRRERQKANREKYRKLAGKESARQRSRRKKKERAMLDAIVKQTNRGGWRPGAGRKPNYFKKIGIKPISAHELLASLDIPKIIGDLVNDRNPAIRLQTLTMLLNRAYGLPHTTGEVNVTGGTASTTEFLVKFVSPDVNNGNPLPHTEWLKTLEQRRFLEGETVEAAPSAAAQPPPPPPEPTGNCRFHGDFLLKDSGGREICPQCKRDAERQENWLAGLMPAGGRQ